MLANTAFFGIIALIMVLLFIAMIGLAIFMMIALIISQFSNNKKWCTEWGLHKNIYYKKDSEHPCPRCNKTRKDK